MVEEVKKQEEVDEWPSLLYRNPPFPFVPPFDFVKFPGTAVRQLEC